MDHPLVIFDSSDEMIFSPEPTAINSNIHFHIHRLSAAGAVTVSEEHYKILNDLFGTPAYSPDPDEDTLTSGISLSTPKMILPEFLKDSTMEPELSFEEVEQEDQLISSPKPLTPSRPTELLDNSEEMERRNVFEMIFSDQFTPVPESLHEFSKDLTMETELSFEDEEHEDQLLSNPKPLTPTRPQELDPVDSDARCETQDPVDSEMVETIVPDPITIESDSDPDIAKNVEKNNVEPVGYDSKHLQQKREISEQDGKKAKKNRVTEWNLSNIFTKSKSQSAFKSEKKRK